MKSARSQALSSHVFVFTTITSKSHSVPTPKWLLMLWSHSREMSRYTKLSNPVCNFEAILQRKRISNILQHSWNLLLWYDLYLYLANKWTHCRRMYVCEILNDWLYRKCIKPYINLLYWSTYHKYLTTLIKTKKMIATQLQSIAYVLLSSK